MWVHRLPRYLRSRLSRWRCLSPPVPSPVRASARQYPTVRFMSVCNLYNRSVERKFGPTRRARTENPARRIRAGAGAAAGTRTYGYATGFRITVVYVLPVFERFSRGPTRDTADTRRPRDKSTVLHTGHTYEDGTGRHGHMPSCAGARVIRQEPQTTVMIVNHDESVSVKSAFSL